jgi:hypothetical protein
MRFCLPSFQRLMQFRTFGRFNSLNLFRVRECLNLSAARETITNLRIEQETGEVVQPPNVAPQDFAIPNVVNKPTPATSEVQAAPPQVEVAPAAMDIREVEYAPAEDVTPQAGMDPMSIDSYRISQQSEPWAEKSNTMRNIGDHFSPGGRPFAYQTGFPNPNFFGVDRNQCCDEWAGHCNCSGGIVLWCLQGRNKGRCFAALCTGIHVGPKIQ